MKYQKFFDFKIVADDYQTVVKNLKKSIDNKQQKSIAAINPEKVITSTKQPKISQLLKKFDYLIPDGSGIVWAIKRSTHQKISRITGIDLMKRLCQLADDNQYKVFFYGAKLATVKLMIKQINQQYPNLKVAGYLDGYQSDNQKIISTINQAQPNILFVALGSPKQEQWIQDNKTQLKVNLIQGVGGSFDVISGNIKRAPLWMQKSNLEWLYRLIKQPKRIFRNLNLLVFAINVMMGKYETK